MYNESICIHNHLNPSKDLDFKSMKFRVLALYQVTANQNQIILMSLSLIITLDNTLE